MFSHSAININFIFMINYERRIKNYVNSYPKIFPIPKDHININLKIYIHNIKKCKHTKNNKYNK